MNGLLDVPRGWFDSLGEIARFGSRVAGLVYSGRVMPFFGEGLRQAGILIFGSALIIWAFVFLLGVQCGLIGAYFVRAQGAPSYAGVFSAYCDLREALPYAFGYILSAKVGTGIVAELGAMRISDEIDALEVMGIPPVTFLAATRLLGAWLALPFIYLVGLGVIYIASYFVVVEQIGDVSSGGYLLLFWTFQDFIERALQPEQGDGDGDDHHRRRLLLRLHRLRRAGRRRHGDGQVDGGQHHHGPHRRHARHPGFLRRQPARADRRLAPQSWQTIVTHSLNAPICGSIGTMAPLGDSEIDARLAEHPGWERDGAAIRKDFKRGDFVGSVNFVRSLVEPAEEMNHHPDLEISWDTVTVSLSTHSDGGVTAADFKLAAKIDALA